MLSVFIREPQFQSQTKDRLTSPDAARVVGGSVELPAGVRPLLVAGAVARAAGEAVGYVGLTPPTIDQRLERLEIHKRDFVPGWR